MLVRGAEISRWSGWIALLAIMLLGAFACSARQHAAPRIESPPRFDWPVADGRLSSRFGMRHGAMHEGIDIAAPMGTPVMAAASGRVIYVGWMRGYGNIVILQHANHYVTVYAHDSQNFVKEGQMVRQGQVIGRIGRTGHTTGPNLHFEVRRNNIAKNPLAYVRPPSTGETRLASGSVF